MVMYTEYRPEVSQVPPGSVDMTSSTAELHVIVVTGDEVLC